MRKNVRQSLKTRFIALILSLITIPFLIVAIVSYMEYMNRLKIISNEYGVALLEQVSVNLNHYMREMERLTLAPLYDVELIKILKKHDKLKNDQKSIFNYEEFNIIQNFMTSQQFDRNEIRSVRLYTLDKHVFSYSDYFQHDIWTDDSSEWMAIAMELEGRAILLPPQNYNYDLSDKKPLISYVRLLREPFSFTPIGYAKIDLTIKNIEDTLFPKSTDSVSPIFIFNNREQIIFPVTMENSSFVPKNNLIEHERELYYVAENSDTKTGISIYELIPYKHIKKEAQTLTRSTVIIALVTLVVAYFIAIVFSNMLIKPLLALTKHFHRIRDGDYSVRAKVIGNDEIAELGLGFNTMATEIQRLVHKVFHVTLKEQEAEILLLQNQMNPHFLNNTLETINMMAVVCNNLNISDVVTSLSRMMKYSISGGEKVIALKEEVEFARNYILIMSHRLGDGLKVDICISHELMSLDIPKFILQPFIENTIEHGYNPSGTRILISAKIIGPNLVIDISDNGKGMSGDKIAELENDLISCVEQTEWGNQLGKIRKGIALRNIHQRIQLMYGFDYGLKIVHSRRKGAHFRIQYPVYKDPENA